MGCGASSPADADTGSGRDTAAHQEEAPLQAQAQGQGSAAEPQPQPQPHQHTHTQPHTDKDKAKDTEATVATTHPSTAAADEHAAALDPTHAAAVPCEGSAASTGTGTVDDTQSTPAPTPAVATDTNTATAPTPPAAMPPDAPTPATAAQQASDTDPVPHAQQASCSSSSSSSSAPNEEEKEAKAEADETATAANAPAADLKDQQEEEEAVPVDAASDPVAQPDSKQPLAVEAQAQAQVQVQAAAAELTATAAAEQANSDTAAASNQAAAADAAASNPAAAEQEQSAEAAAAADADAVASAASKPQEVAVEEPAASNASSSSQSSSPAAPATATSAPSGPPTSPAPPDSAPPSESDVASCDENLLFVLRLDTAASDEALAVVHESQPAGAFVRISGPGGPGKLDERVGALSWRWDIAKPATLAEARALPPSPKIVRAIRRARDLGLKWVWIDWCTVPQYSRVEEILNHVRASRFVYEKCRVILVDTVELAPGICIPTPDYISRLWTTAEMASMLCNAAVNYGSFVQVTRWHHQSIILATSHPWAAVMVRSNFVSEYLAFADRYLGKNARGPLSKEYEFRQSDLHSVCYNLGATYVMQRYGSDLMTWLSSNPNKFSCSSRCSLSLKEEEQLIREHETKYTMDARQNPLCKPLWQAMKKHKTMPDSWSLESNYKIYLLLAAEIVKKYLLPTWQFNQACYKSVLQRLGQQFPGTDPPSGRDVLACFLESDVEKVREMINAARGRVDFPATINGVKFIPVPLKQWLSVNYPVPAELSLPKGGARPSIAAMLRHCTLHARPGLDDSQQPLRNVSFDVCYTGAARTALSSSADIYTPTSVLRFAATNKDATAEESHAVVTVDANAQWTREIAAVKCQGVELREGEFWLSLSLTFVTNTGQSHRLSFFRAARSNSATPLTASTLASLAEQFLSWAQSAFESQKDAAAKIKWTKSKAAQKQVEDLVKSSDLTFGPALATTGAVAAEDDNAPPSAEEKAATAAEDEAAKLRAELLAHPGAAILQLTEEMLAAVPLSFLPQFRASLDAVAPPQ